ncbi:hypothetical protein TGDOM2_262655 [Toxoplasma gondii GAB2-2007-GAL-DOM2]|uniref:Uncharacterized protein n=8 Tax=Toxoplasma gondii TaxID=5811 RepID=A0A125YYA7_TOXGV|nr:hypothetical protein TGGT1_262655 [Toxoplasma gondii GT1]ESS31895.1 hypothetical protein TGVEG_262655 [Toxoplasma gondii VEG]KFG35114.1 hypothetical protein TGP89_262655 [Toxoplasma gondii p89]KFG49641.1 hypothetical protein TGDOM2_262655 [Toxoplasma gondii GAB2-2007-GAL-DOM2]KFG52660.1 hypothetical protein TGFOU_262655 [Toxoplasma gondii FOU]KFH10404.1 hypothetical protein TGVAND_262655 [Toxoplasma gondii VAND]PUA89814.1 hypothetical protein TGBR9_262655 [Toxoplasma gondii TgCATBr9]RQX71
MKSERVFLEEELGAFELLCQGPGGAWQAARDSLRLCFPKANCDESRLPSKIDPKKCRTLQVEATRQVAKCFRPSLSSPPCLLL